MSLSRSVLVAWRPLLAMGLLAGLSGAGFNRCFNEEDVHSWPSNSFDFSGVDRFGLKLFRKIAPLTAPSSNLLMSPYSIWSVLTLALIGAQGSTREQLHSALGLPPTKLGVIYTKNALDFVLNGVSSGVPDGPELRGVDRVYIDRSLPLRPCVAHAIPSVESVNFSDAVGTSKKINDDVSKATEGQIPDLLSPNSLANAVFVLINAIYFKGNWLHTFFDGDTTKQVFYNEEKVQVATADMMTQQGFFNIVYSPAMGATMLELPYDKSNMSMLILLPDIKKPSVDGVLSALNPHTLEQALSASQELFVRVFLPKFNLETRLQDELVKALNNVGISHMFDNTKANFSDFSDSPLAASTAIHQAKVIVDEVGTVAAAVTAIIGTRSAFFAEAQFIANRPFVFLIYEKRVKVTLFAGVIRDPTK